MELLRHFADQKLRPRLNPLGAQHQRRRADRGFGQHRADVLRGRDDQQRIARREIPKRAGRPDRGRQRNACEKAAILVRLVDRSDHVGLARP
jgi:hypothetical protein